MNKKTIKDINLTKKSIIVRVDYNVSVKKKDGVRRIADDTRYSQAFRRIN